MHFWIVDFLKTVEAKTDIPFSLQVTMRGPFSESHCSSLIVVLGIPKIELKFIYIQFYMYSKGFIFRTLTSLLFGCLVKIVLENFFSLTEKLLRLFNKQV